MELRLNKLPWQAQVGLFVAIGLAGAGAFYYFYAITAEEQLTAKRQELATLTTDIQKGLATARKLHEFRREVAELEARLETLRAVLPEQKDYADILRRIQSLASQSNLTIKAFKPEPIVTKELHAEWPIHLELDGTYHNLGMFFDRISKFPRIINVADIRIKGKDKPDSNTTIEAVCAATTFVLLQPGAGKAAARPSPNKRAGAAFVDPTATSGQP